MFKKYLLLLGILFLGFGHPATGLSETPKSTIEQSVNQVLSILQDPKYKPEDQKEAQRKVIWTKAHELFDFYEMSQRTIGKYWPKLKPQEKEQFSDLFARFLSNIYYSKLEQYTNEKIQFLNEKMQTNEKAIVQTTIITATAEIPMDYSLILKDGIWKVYDVNIEGVSLVRNYRTQFNQILSKNNISELINRLKTKLGRFVN